MSICFCNQRLVKKRLVCGVVNDSVHKPLHREAGAALVTTLMLLLVLTLVALTSMENNNLNIKMGMNTVNHTTAFNYSESGRDTVASVIDENVFEQNWSDVTMPTGLSAVDSTQSISDGNGTGEDVYDASTLVKDLDYSDGNIDSDVYVVKEQTIINNNSGMAMVAGYEGLGKSSSKGGISIYFEVRSNGNGPNNSRVVTASDYRSVVTN